MDCKKEENKVRCNCTYEPCSRKGICCECLAYHLSRNELPACCFPDDVEKTYDRSFERFISLYSK
ncbi:MAG TPA: cytosolic protein [Thermoplasmatales archaeon]|nr:cytosolic protein [Thermoplasmatales archaeon]